MQQVCGNMCWRLTRHLTARTFTVVRWVKGHHACLPAASVSILPARHSSTQDGPLSGVRIVDLTRILAGPFATMVLSDLGAEVIKVERPGSGDDTRTWGPPFLGTESCYFLSVNRNKKSVAVDLKQPDGVQVVQDLVRCSDVLVENFVPGALDRLGLGSNNKEKQNTAEWQVFWKESSHWELQVRCWLDTAAQGSPPCPPHSSWVLHTATSQHC